MAAVTAGLITAGASLLGQGVNAYAQGRMNKKTMKFSREMYDVQRRDAMSDWNMQNQYNSPEAQMQRLKDAGLNPNLVYGATAPGNSSGQVHQATPPAWSPKAPQFDASSPMSSYFNTAMASAQLDNLEAMNAKIKAETSIALSNAGLRDAELKYADNFYSNRGLLTAENRVSKGLDNELKQHLLDPTLMSLDNPQLRESVAYRTALQKFEKLGIDKQIQKAILEGKHADNVLKDLDIQLRKNGINPSDPIHLRIIGRLIGQFMDTSQLINPRR